MNSSFYCVLIAQFLTALTDNAVLFMAGVCGGLFLVPTNAALQEIDHRIIGNPTPWRSRTSSRF